MTQQRYILFDIIRLMSMIAIIHFHTHEFFYFSDTHVLKGQSYLNTWLEHYSRFMSFSGFTIILLSFFLMGFKGVSPAKAKKLFVASALGIVVLLLANYEDSFYFEWDIYSYVIVSVLAVLFLARNQRLLMLTSLAFFVLLLFPRSYYLNFPISLGFLQNPLIGDYKTLGAGSWPLIPWLGLAIVPFFVGQWFSEHRQKLKTMDLVEKLLWMIALLMSLPQLGSYYAVPIGPNFYNFVFNCGTLNFWSHLVWIFFLMRLSFFGQVNETLVKFNKINWVSKLQLNQRFFLFYLLQIAVISLFSLGSEWFYENPLMIDIYLLAFIPIVETLCRLIPNKTNSTLN